MKYEMYKNKRYLRFLYNIMKYIPFFFILYFETSGCFLYLNKGTKWSIKHKPWLSLNIRLNQIPCERARIPTVVLQMYRCLCNLRNIKYVSNRSPELTSCDIPAIATQSITTWEEEEL